MMGVQDLDVPVLRLVFKSLDTRSLVICCGVSKHWQKIISSDLTAFGLWAALFKRCWTPALTRDDVVSGAGTNRPTASHAP